MARKEYSLEIRYNAEDLFVDSGLTYKEIEKELSVGISTLKRWGKDGSWSTLRKEKIKNSRTLKENLRKLHIKLSQRAADTANLEDIYGVIKLEKLNQDERKLKAKNQQETVDIDYPKLGLEFLETLAEVLKEHDPAGLKLISKNFDRIVDKFKERYAEAS
ncbi:MAG: hypothetical protein GY714_10515 [Desulfobacterales bacterium]|nr:hypothetical protein [Desulfobacterales bacterium]